MKTRTSHPSLTNSNFINERYQRRVVSYLEKGQLDLREATKKYHVKNAATLIQWIRKYGIFDPDYIVVHQMSTTNDYTEVKKLKELLKAKDDEITRLKKEVYLNKQKGIMVDALIEIVKEDYNIDLSKKVMPGQLTSISSKEAKEE